MPNADALTPVAPSMRSPLAQLGGDVQNWEASSDANAQFSAEPTNPSLNPPSQNLEDASVRSPAARGADEPNRSDLSAATHSAQAAPPTDFRTRLLEALSDKNLRYYAGPGFSEFIDKLAALVPLLPGSGTVQSMQDSAQAGKDGRKLRARSNSSWRGGRQSSARLVAVRKASHPGRNGRENFSLADALDC